MKRQRKTERPKAGAGLAWRPRGGFSLIEVLISLVILSVGLMAIAQMQVAAIRGIAFSRHMTSATYLARQQLEYLRSLPYDDGSPTDSPLDSSGNPIVDKAGNGVLIDDSNGSATAALGDGLPSDFHEHANNPLSETGAAAQAGEMPYYVRWTVERGGPNGTAGGLSPGAQQMVIVVEVIWWENNQSKPDPVDLMADWDSLEATRAHRVRLTTLRQQTL